MFTKSTVLFLLFAVFGLGRAWAGDEPPSPMTNKEAIALVQTNADYVLTLVAAAAGAVLAMVTSWMRIGIPDVGMRVSADEEREGLDYTEHGGTAYPDFEVSSYVQK